MKNVHMQSLWYVFALAFSLSACNALGTEGNVGVGIVVAVLVVLGLGGIALKFMGGILKIGIWGIAILVLLVIGFIAFIIIKSMG